MPAAGFAELMTGPDRKPLAMNQPFATAGQPQEILLGGVHRVVMNRHTKATFSAASARSDVAHAGKVPYEIQLAQGELFVEVVPGNQFTVKTANARLDITGTKFDVRTDGDKTELTLLKGGVRLSQLAAGAAAGAAEAFVDVTAGHASAVIGRSAPTTPRQADALAATAWARGLALTNTVAGADGQLDAGLSAMTQNAWAQQAMPDVNTLDYAMWRNDHRDWFAREFPWIFKAQTVLKDRNGIDADYIELLMVSGDIWQFNYPRAIKQPIPILNAAAIKQIAAHYGADPAGLLTAVGANLPAAAHALADRATIEHSKTQSLAESAKEYRAALERWHSDIANLSRTPEGNTAANGAARNMHSDLLFRTLRAGAYLKTTRTAAWLWARNNPAQATELLASKNHGIAFFTPARSGTFEQWLTRFHGDTMAACSIRSIAGELLTTTRATGCDRQEGNLSNDIAKVIARLLQSPEDRQQ